MELFRHPMFHTLEHKIKALLLIYLDSGRYSIILLAFQTREAACSDQHYSQKAATRHMRFLARHLCRNRLESESRDGHRRFLAVVLQSIKKLIVPLILGYFQHRWIFTETSTPCLPRISLPRGKTFCAIRKIGLQREIYEGQYLQPSSIIIHVYKFTMQ
jgi:hypothetical protein